MKINKNLFECDSKGWPITDKKGNLIYKKSNKKQTPPPAQPCRNNFNDIKQEETKTMVTIPLDELIKLIKESNETRNCDCESCCYNEDDDDDEDEDDEEDEVEQEVQCNNCNHNNKPFIYFTEYNETTKTWEEIEDNHNSGVVYGNYLF